MKYLILKVTIGLLLVGTAAIAQQPTPLKPGENLKFVSFPDFFNFDIPNPWPPYEQAVNYFLGQVSNEKPDFVLVGGDMVGGLWWDSPQCVIHNAAIYYPAWINRMKEHGLKFYTAVGDHELGDNPWPREKIELIPYFEEAYRTHFKMPENGPDHLKGLAYYVRKGDLLLVTVYPFEVVDDSMHIDICKEQLDWFKKVLKNNEDATFRVVQGHVGLWGELNARSSSALMLAKGKNSDFYKVMKENGVDLYLAGEFHDVTVLESDGIWQIVHGSSWGREIVNTQDYLVGEIKGNKLIIQLKRIYMDAKGEHMWNLNKRRDPREIVEINERTLKYGPEVTGTLTIVNEAGKKSFMNRSGYFK